MKTWGLREMLQAPGHVALGTVILLATACSPQDVDPRLIDGSATDVSISDVAPDFGLAVPTDDAIKEWGYFPAPTGTGFALWLHDECRNVANYMRDSGLGAALRADDAPVVLTAGDTYGWDIDPETFVGVSDDYSADGNAFRAAAVSDPGGDSCDAYIRAWTV